MERRERIAGCLFGMALGDAFGAPTEFLGTQQILRRWPPAGPQEPYGYPSPPRRSAGHLSAPPEAASTILVTDDTQMAIAVGQALRACLELDALTPEGMEDALRETFVSWLDSPDNVRAPGNTCLMACEGLRKGLPWLQATRATSKGCGANMRVQPVGCLRVGQHLPDTQSRAALAQFQAAITHGHPTALAAADLTAFVIASLLNELAPQDILEACMQYAQEQHDVYHHAWLGTLWQRPGVSSPEDFITRGWRECFRVLRRIERALETPKPDQDPCEQVGEGWIAEEAFAAGLLCFLLFPEQPIAAIQRASVSAGDSDSLACLAGAFAGAAYGIDAWPASWCERIEYRDSLQLLVHTLG